MTDDQRILYDNAGEIRNTDVIVRWNIATVFMLVHSAGITFVWTRPVAEHIALALIFRLVGLFLALIWLFLNVRMQTWIQYWNSKIELLERKAEPQMIRVFGGTEYEQIRNHPTSTYNILKVLNGVVVLGWFVMFELALFSR